MKRGFTLAELLAVTVLLALIVAISYPILFNSFEKKEQELDNAKKELIYNAAENYIKMNGNLYPYAINKEVCVFLKDLTDQKLVAVELSDSFNSRIVKVKMLENNQYFSKLLEENEECKDSGGIKYKVKSCKEKVITENRYELRDKRIQYTIGGNIKRQIDNIYGKNLSDVTNASYDNLVNNYNNVNDLLKYKDLYYSKFDKGKDYFKMIVDIDMQDGYNTFSSDEKTILANASIFYNNGIDTTCNE